MSSNPLFPALSWGQASGQATLPLTPVDLGDAVAQGSNTTLLKAMSQAAVQQVYDSLQILHPGALQSSRIEEKKNLATPVSASSVLPLPSTPPTAGGTLPPSSDGTGIPPPPAPHSVSFDVSALLLTSPPGSVSSSPNFALALQKLRNRLASVQEDYKHLVTQLLRLVEATAGNPYRPSMPGPILVATPGLGEAGVGAGAGAGAGSGANVLFPLEELYPLRASGVSSLQQDVIMEAQPAPIVEDGAGSQHTTPEQFIIELFLEMLLRYGGNTTENAPMCPVSYVEIRDKNGTTFTLAILEHNVQQLWAKLDSRFFDIGNMGKNYITRVTGCIHNFLEDHDVKKLKKKPKFVAGSRMKARFSAGCLEMSRASVYAIPFDKFREWMKTALRNRHRRRHQPLPEVKTHSYACPHTTYPAINDKIANVSAVPDVLDVKGDWAIFPRKVLGDDGEVVLACGQSEEYLQGTRQRCHNRIWQDLQQVERELGLPTRVLPSNPSFARRHGGKDWNYVPDVPVFTLRQIQEQFMSLGHRKSSVASCSSEGCRALEKVNKRKRQARAAKRARKHQDESRRKRPRRGRTRGSG